MISLESLKSHIHTKPATTEETPFDPEVLVFKVLGKMYALIAWEEEPLSISLKCEPEEAVLLRQKYPSITPGYHLNKPHWNTILLAGSIPDDENFEMIADSYELVVEKLPKRDQAKLLDIGKEKESA